MMNTDQNVCYGVLRGPNAPSGPSRKYNDIGILLLDIIPRSGSSDDAPYVSVNRDLQFLWKHITIVELPLLEKITILSKDSTMSVLVAYATAKGSTREIANRIASRLHSSGTAVDCRSVDDVISLDQYSTVIIGSAVHGQKWLPDATRFLERERERLENRQLWAFSVGMGAGLPSWIRERAMRGEEKKLRAKIETYVKPREHVLFSGTYTSDEMPGCFRVIYSCFGGRFGDLREWDKIDQWADRIAQEAKLHSGVA
jgi:menaquinone-dependent protoporphyrinogen oxidase